MFQRKEKESSIKITLNDRTLDDTIAEFKSQCPEIEEILTAFVSQPEWFNTGNLMTTIQNRVLQATNPRITGVMGRATPIDVAQFLYQIGFLTAREDRSDGSYDHVMFSENASLLNSRTNLDQGYSWEIHPVFRQALKLKNIQERR